MSTRYRISTPVAGFTGVVGNCAFGNGTYEGEVELGPLAYFRQAGYTVEELDEKPKPAPTRARKAAGAKATDTTPVPPELPSDDASEAVWRVYAVQHGGLTTEEVNDMDDLAKVIEAVKKGQTS